jgi:hypothetical protein
MSTANQSVATRTSMVVALATAAVIDGPGDRRAAQRLNQRGHADLGHAETARHHRQRARERG